MNVKVIEHAKNLQVIIECQQVNEAIMRLKSHIELFDSKIQAKSENKVCFISSADVLYFESVDNHIFLYTTDSVMEIKQRLYELELMLSDKDFIRISKSQIVNINKIHTLRPQINRTILATMCNGEQLSISRTYVKSFRSMLSL